MATNVKQKIYRSMLTSMFSFSLATASMCGVTELCEAQSVKKITSDPYYSALRQNEVEAKVPPVEKSSDSFYQSAWQPPKTDVVKTPARQAKMNKAETAAEVWSSVARKTTKPVTRVDFSRLNLKPAKNPADVALPQTLQPIGAAGAVAKTAGALKTQAQALTPIKTIGKLTDVAAKAPQKAQDAINNLKTKTAQTRSIIRQKSTDSLAALKTPAAVVIPPVKPNPLTPRKDPGEFNMPKLTSKLPVSTEKAADKAMAEAPKDFIGQAKKISTEIKKDSDVKLAAYEPQLGKNVKKLGEKIKTLAASERNAPQQVPPQQGTRVADASTSFFTPGTTYTPQGEVYSQPAQVTQPAAPVEVHEQPQYQGESFENSRVLALVGGQPVFAGDMMFEMNQILERFMKGAPQAAKDAQKEKLMARLLPKYIDQKILYVTTLDQLPDGADIEDILKQAEKTFNEKALPDMMEKSGVESVLKFDAILRSQGSSVRHMRRGWAKDQISKFFLQEQVKYNRKVTHLEMLDEYRSNYDEYAMKGKVRWEQIEIQPGKAGGRFAAKDKIEDIYNRLVHGGNFEAIAKKESHGFRAFKGGQYDWTTRGSLVNKEIDKSIFTLPQGKLSGVIETKSGFHIIRVIERIEDHHTPFTEAQVEIKKQLLNDRRDKAFRSHIDGLKENIDIEYVNE